MINIEEAIAKIEELRDNTENYLLDEQEYSGWIDYINGLYEEVKTEIAKLNK